MNVSVGLTRFVPSNVIGEGQKVVAGEIRKGMQVKYENLSFFCNVSMHVG